MPFLAGVGVPWDPGSEPNPRLHPQEAAAAPMGLGSWQGHHWGDLVPPQSPGSRVPIAPTAWLSPGEFSPEHPALLGVYCHPEGGYQGPDNGPQGRCQRGLSLSELLRPVWDSYSSMVQFFLLCTKTHLLHFRKAKSIRGLFLQAYFKRQRERPTVIKRIVCGSRP